MAEINPTQLDYRASEQHLMGRAREHGADDNVICAGERLPANRFSSSNEVSEVGEVA